jgi:hypothetical protein
VPTTSLNADSLELAESGSTAVDLGEHRRVAHHGRDALEARAGERDAERPRDEQRRGTAEHGATDRVERAHRLPGDLVADAGADHLEERLPQRRAHDDDEERGEGHQDRRGRVAEHLGASQTPIRPPRSSPVVAKAPVTKPCQ